MLSFMQDDQTPETPKPQGAPVDAQAPQTGPDTSPAPQAGPTPGQEGPGNPDSGPVEPDGQISSEADYLLPAEHGKAARQSTIILVVLFALGSLVVWFMVKKVGPKALFAAGPTPAEQALDQYVTLVNGMEAEFTTAVDDLMGRFDQFSNIEQVGVAELAKNPFRSDLAIQPGQPEPDTSRIKAQIDAKRRAEKLQLWSIMASPQGACCMINEKILYVGDVIEGFTVDRIEERFVDLTYDGFTFRLQMMQ